MSPRSEDSARSQAFRLGAARLPAHRSDVILHLIYPIPDPQLPFLGIHLTRTIDGGVTVGPNAVLGLARDGYRRRSVNVADLQPEPAGIRAQRSSRRRTGARLSFSATGRTLHVGDAPSRRQRRPYPSPPYGSNSFSESQRSSTIVFSRSRGGTYTASFRRYQIGSRRDEHKTFMVDEVWKVAQVHRRQWQIKGRQQAAIQVSLTGRGRPRFSA